MGPCIAMGTAAAHALDLAGTKSVHEIDLPALQKRLTDNLDRRAGRPASTNTGGGGSLDPPANLTVDRR
jgi:hypothetical protein